MKILYWLLIVIALFSFRLRTNEVHIKGHFRIKGLPTCSISHVQILVKGENKILAKTTTDKAGNFKMTFTPLNEKSFDFYTVKSGDTSFLKSFTYFDSDTPELTFYLVCKK